MGRLLLVAASCYVATWYGMLLPIGDGITHPFSIASGIALAAVLRWGEPMAWAAGVGALAASLSIDLMPTAAVLHAVGATLEAILAGRLFVAVGGTRSFTSSRCILGLIIAAPLAAVVSATATLTAYELAGGISIAPLEAWARYLLANTIGILVITPVIITWTDRSYQPTYRRRWWEMPIAGGAVVATGSISLVDDHARFIELLLALPALSWAAVRFGPRGASTSVAVFGLLVGVGIRAGRMLEDLQMPETIDAVQALLAVTAASNLVIAAILAERQQALARVREVIDTFNHSQRVSRSGSWEYRLDGRERVWLSDELCRLLSITPDADHCVALEVLLDTMPERERTRLRAAIRNARLTGRAFRLDQRIPNEHGDERVLLHVGELVAPLGPEQVERLVGSLLDVTEEREMEAFKDDLIATASHELRTPLTSIVGFADTLSERWNDVTEPERRNFVGIIDEQAHRLERIVEDTLMQSQVDAGTLHPERRPFLLGRSVRSVIAAQPGTERVELDLEPGIMAFGDPGQFEQVIENLLTNALKYGRPPLAVRSRTRDGSTVEVRVEDHGPGVPGSFRTRLFDRFARGPDVGTAPGTGLGLSIARGLVEAAGGSISYERWHGVTTFTVRMPAAHLPPRR